MLQDIIESNIQDNLRIELQLIATRNKYDDLKSKSYSFK